MSFYPNSMIYWDVKIVLYISLCICIICIRNDNLEPRSLPSGLDNKFLTLCTVFNEQLGTIKRLSIACKLRGY